MQISLFKNVSEVRNPELLDLIDYLNDTKEGKWQDAVTECRKITDEEEKRAYKRKMPTATLSGTFSYRDDSSLVKHSEILAMDLDDVDDLNLLKAKLKQDKYTLSVFMSTGGYGLRWLVRILPKKHKEATKGALQYLFDTYGITADPNTSLSKPYIVSYDPDLYVNLDPVRFEYYVKETVIKNIPTYVHNSDDFENVYKQIVGRRINLCENYDDWIRVGFGIAEEFGESGRSLFHELSSFSEKYNYTRCDKQYNAFLRRKRDGATINIRTFYYLAKANGINISSERTKEIVRTTRNGKRAGLKPKQIRDNLREKGGIDSSEEFINKIWESNEKDDLQDSDDASLHVLEMFIKNTYDLRFNEVSGFFEDQGKVINPNAMNTMYIAAKKILPKLDYGLMIRLLKSDFIPSFNPFYEFFKSDGIPYILPPNPLENQQVFDAPIISKLAETIKCHDEAYSLFFLKKWLVSIVSAAHKVHSPLLYCLLGKQHTGKTEFFRRLMPKELRQYYAESKLDKEKDDEMLMCENLIIMDDELGGKTKQDNLKLKNITSKQWFSLRRPYGDHNEKLLRLAVLCGTSNYKKILSDPTGNRRIIPVDVEDIDKVLYNKIDKKELFMEMFRLYKQGFDWRITPTDLKLLNKDEDKFTEVVKERELIMRYFSPENPNDKMTTTDIVVYLEKQSQQRLNVRDLGRELEALGFIRRKLRYGQFNAHVGTFWMVNKINQEGVIEAWTPNKNSPF